jgi:hypothetical protein
MPLRRSPVSVALSLQVLVAGLVLAACSSPTDVDPLSISLRVVPFATDEERLQWPASPTVEGGESLIVRGWIFTGCGRPEAEVRRRDNVVGVEVRAVDTDRICLAIVAAWLPIEATVSGLPPGAYRVRVGLAGMPDRTEGTVAIAAP